MKKYIVIMLSICFFVSCSQTTNETDKTPISTDAREENIDSNQYVQTEETEIQQIENIAFLNRKISLRVVLKHYKGHTSGRSNKPDLISDCDTSKEMYYGFYCIMGRESGIADIFVSFEKLPWLGSDTNQKILMLNAYDKLFKFNPFSFAVGDSIEKINSSLKKQTVIDDIHYYTGEGCTIAAKTQNNIISSYLIWVCNTSIDDIHKKHSRVKQYL